ncbi:MORN repeat-containing protein 1 isoform X1 [Grus americana]|uniref:MORN repeat-containing protein 1 isoform X1 n=1 Tax=Grus americana TaxID=9117 RepID=UPI0024086FC2|nr:MORN repeat-containing protein 1 isoform X1 [Grus americana]
MLGINSVLSRKKFFESRSVPVSCSRKEFLLFLFVPVQGQWRNDVFNEQGVIVNCSGDICDGLWINGYPADMDVSPQRK